MYDAHVTIYQKRKKTKHVVMSISTSAMILSTLFALHGSTISAQEKIDNEYVQQYVAAIGPVTYTNESLTSKANGYNLIEPELVSEDSFKKGVCPGSKSTITGSKLLAPINKKESVGDYVPPNLVEIQGHIKTRGGKTVCLEETTANNLLALFNDAVDGGYDLEVTSGYRSPSAQLSLYNQAIQASGFKGTLRVAPPYHSEHHLNAVDISTPQVATKGVALADTESGKWLIKNAHKYGFVMSYPKGKEYITGYQNEDWHWKFVGIENAKLIVDSGLTFHEIVTSPSTRIITKAEAIQMYASVQKPKNPKKEIIEIGG